jgi:hypothetical protein
VKVQTLALAVCAAATALLLPALQTGAAADPGGNGKKASPSPSATPTPTPTACAVTVHPADSVGSAGGPVLASAELKNSPTAHPANAGFYVEKSTYDSSSTFQATISYTPPAGGGCGSISLLTFPLVVVNGQETYLAQVQSRTVHLSGDAKSVTVDSLVAGLPANSKQGDGGLCVGSQIQVRDSNGAVTATFPSKGPLDFCPDAGGGRTYAG